MLVTGNGGSGGNVQTKQVIEFMLFREERHNLLQRRFSAFVLSEDQDL